ncbi:ubiquitin-like protein Pup [Bifidobacterium sp. ESL0763]|uniref:ubiquitin-like protein Pup n=1 Tax=Bifidobacterium sp. ESL0763 TaxID=2983227 RepID=UPI0023FA2857|nr:ubiquitin-like protein Pup [Bifidobacterium sp. ESL0763]MDF7663651.1 ubiquitin-like protein Pup [Bifidobacterium sp. ESL0763]
MPQQFSQHYTSDQVSGQPEAQDGLRRRTTDSAQAESDALDAVLDDISSTLEHDAERYVASFVQKGGQ